MNVTTKQRGRLAKPVKAWAVVNSETGRILDDNQGNGPLLIFQVVSGHRGLLIDKTDRLCRVEIRELPKE